MFVCSLTGWAGWGPQTETFIMRPCVFAHHVNIKTTLPASNKGQIQSVSPPLLTLSLISFQLTSMPEQDEVFGSKGMKFVSVCDISASQTLHVLQIIKALLPCNMWVRLFEKCSTSIRIPVRIMFEQVQQTVTHCIHAHYKACWELW